MIEGPTKIASHWQWAARDEDVEVRFIGRGPRRSRAELASQVGDENVALASLEQRHTALCHAITDDAAVPVGDALWTERPGLALSVVTVDCVPLLLAGSEGIAAIHAGWRGVVAGVVASALDHFREGGAGLRAWIGPAIGPCCYEVGREVAAEVSSASSPLVVSWPRGRGRRPHLDLSLAVALQLERFGVPSIERVPQCTRCQERLLWSYRRDGPGKGRNLALIWRRTDLDSKPYKGDEIRD